VLVAYSSMIEYMSLYQFFFTSKNSNVTSVCEFLRCDEKCDKQFTKMKNTR